MTQLKLRKRLRRPFGLDNHARTACLRVIAWIESFLSDPWQKINGTRVGYTKHKLTRNDVLKFVEAV